MESLGEANHKGSLRLELEANVLLISWNARGYLTQVELHSSAPYEKPSWIPARAFRLSEDLTRYFRDGAPISSVSWDDIAFENWTEFQKKVYAATLAIPHGETRTYGWIAWKLGTPMASRAVGQALGRNPVPLVIPCHRVVSTQSLGGFMGEDGPETPELGLKRRLLDLENRFVNPTFSFGGMSA